MLDDFFVRALVAGIGIALLSGPLGCFVVWRKLSYFGDTLSHAALLGVALGLLLQINIIIAVFVVAALAALLLALLENRSSIPTDALLGLLSHSALATGLVVLSFMTWVRFDLNGLLFGDILSVSTTDIALIFGIGLPVLGLLIAIWHPLFAATVNTELAEAEGQNPARYRLAFTLLMAFVIAVSLKIVGALLITALLIIPAATARRFAVGPEQMAALAAVLGAISVVGGLNASLHFDTPAGPSVVVAGALLFALSLSPVGNALTSVLRGKNNAKNKEHS